MHYYVVGMDKNYASSETFQNTWQWVDLDALKIGIDWFDTPITEAAAIDKV